VTSASDELRAAATRLRSLATAATPGPWEQTGIGDYGWTVSSSSSALVDTVDSEEGRADADYIAAMHPGVGLALAAWLESEAEFGLNPGIDPAALTVARAINTGGRP
jgi:hypothetical protein